MEFEPGSPLAIGITAFLGGIAGAAIKAGHEAWKRRNPEKVLFREAKRAREQAKAEAAGHAAARRVRSLLGKGEPPK